MVLADAAAVRVRIRVKNTLNLSVIHRSFVTGFGHISIVQHQSLSVMGRWVLKVRGLEDKKKRYEQVSQQELG